MDKHILSTAILHYETESLFRAIPFDCTEAFLWGVPSECRCEIARGEERRSVLFVSCAVLVSTSMTSVHAFLPLADQTLTRAPSGTLLCPAISSVRECMNASVPPATVTNPKPFSALNHLTIASTDSDACSAIGRG